MISYANQKIYHITKKVEEGDVFIMLKWEDYTEAARELSPSALNLFMYLAKNQDGYEFWFSSKDYCKTFQVTDKTYRNARDELTKKGYLKADKNNHIFFDTKRSFAETKEKLQKRLKEILYELRNKNTDSYEKIIEELTNAKLKEIENENVYKIEIKKIISFAEDMLNEITEIEVKNLI